MAVREIALTIPVGLYRRPEATAAQTQRDTAAVILDALSAYLPPMPPELAAWDALSDEAFWEFERNLCLAKFPQHHTTIERGGKL